MLVIFPAASLTLLAKFLISKATTANPLPCSPARAASTAAFNAKIFVCNAISCISFVIFEISLLEDDISYMLCPYLLLNYYA